MVSSRRGIESIGHTEINVVPTQSAEATRLLRALDTKTLRLVLRHMGFVNHIGLLNEVNDLVVAPVEMALIDSEGIMSRRYHKKGPARRTL